MGDRVSSIKPLSPDVAAQIKSSTSIPSLPSVILGLIENSLDAEACKIDITVDWSRGAVTVEDDGVGIPPKEFTDSGGLGKLYHTSKSNSLSNTFGRSGTFLASVAALSILTISSHHSAHLQHASLILHHSRPAARLIPSPFHLQLSNREHGTRVTVQDLFGSMPVRVKQRAIESASGVDEKHFEAVKKRVIGLLLAWHRPVSVSLRSSQDNKRLCIRSKKEVKSSGNCAESSSSLFDLSLVCNVLSQAGYIESSGGNDWIKTSARTPFIVIKGAISLRPAPSKQVQFLFMGVRPISAETGSHVLYDEINRLFASSSFGNQEDIADNDEVGEAKRRKDRRFKMDGFTNKQLKGGGKGVDRWPMFCIRIDIQGRQIGDEQDVEKLGEITMVGLIKVLGAMIIRFLDDNHFRPRAKPKAPQRPKLKSPLKQLSSSAIRNGSINTGPENKVRKNYDGDMFSIWGRIKTGIEVKSFGKSPPPSSPSIRSLQPKSHDTINPSLQTDPDDASSVVNAEETPETKGLTTVHEETMIEWRNPKSGATVLVNARTGLVINDRSSRRPATAPSRLSSLSSPTLPARASLTLKKRPTCSKSSPLVEIPAVPCSNDFLKRWKNPVFDVTEEAIPQVSLDGPSIETSDILHGRHHYCSDLEIQKAFMQSSSSYLAKFSRRALKDARVIAQVDQKFILVCMAGNTSPSSQAQEPSLLVLIDQHAADERIRVENLLADLNASPALLTNFITFELPDREHALLARHTSYFSSWGINYDVNRTGNPPKCRITVKALPASIAERCRIEPKILIDLLRGEAWKREELGVKPKPGPQNPDPQSTELATKRETWLTRLSTCPQALLDMLNSRACRSAIMFNDALTTDECCTLIRKLADCHFPFQCAHGRPSMVPLVDVGSDAEGEGLGGGNWGNGDGDEGEGFGRAWGRWRG